MFFKAQGTTQYKFGDETYKLTDITNVSIMIDVNKSILQTVSVNSRSPEQIANDIYGDSSLFWTVLYINNIVDPFTDWYMNDTQLYKYCVRIYGEDNVYKNRYYKNIITNTYIIGIEAEKYHFMDNNEQPLPEQIIGISNYTHEEMKNANRRQIQVIPKTYITRFVDDYKKALKGEY